MNARDRYHWDLTGHLILRGVLTPEEVKAANDAIDYCSDEINPGEANRLSRGSSFLQGLGRPSLSGTQLLNIDKPHCDIFRRMLVHPAIISRLLVMCGKGVRLDHGPQFIGGVKGTSGHALHGSGAPHKDYVAYHHQNGKPYVGGVTVSWQLTEIPEGKGGFACVPGSHKSDFPTPRGVTTVDDPMGTVIQPGCRPGDVVFFMDGAQTHGTFPWINDHERRSILYKYASRTSARSGPAGEKAAPEIYWDEEIVDGMTPEQRAVMFGPYSGHRGAVPYLDVSADGTVKIAALAQDLPD
jgi:hypothetical protein